MSASSALCEYRCPHVLTSSIGLPFFIEHFQGPSQTPVIMFTPQNINLTVTVAIVGSTVAPLISPFLQKRFGRKKTILIAYGGFCVPASLLQLFA
jgi:MFS family permease